MKIMLFGDSHLAAVRRGMAQVKIPPKTQISYWGTPGHRFRQIEWRDGKIVPSNESAARAFARFSNDQQEVLDPSQYDIVAFIGARIRPGAVIPDVLNHMMHANRHLSQGFIRALLAEHLRKLTTYQMARSMAAEGRTHVMLNPISYDTEGKAPLLRSLTRARRAGVDQQNQIRAILTDIMAEDGIEAALQPLDTVTKGYMTDARYGLETDDATHKNTDYGARVLQQILTQAGVMKAPPKPRARRKTTKGKSPHV